MWRDIGLTTWRHRLRREELIELRTLCRIALSKLFEVSDSPVVEVLRALNGSVNSDVSRAERLWLLLSESIGRLQEGAVRRVRERDGRMEWAPGNRIERQDEDDQRRDVPARLTGVRPASVPSSRERVPVEQGQSEASRRESHRSPTRYVAKRHAWRNVRT